MGEHPHAEIRWFPDRSRRRWAAVLHAAAGTAGWVLRRTIARPAARVLAPVLDVGQAPRGLPVARAHR
ncbi:MAG: hypothetical protein ACQEXJ_05100 [Myxococcota bacterium]